MTTAKILVTGATGFLGRVLMPQLLKAQRPVVLCIRSDSTCPTEWQENQNLAIVQTGSLETATNVAAALEDVAIVVHMAGLAHVDTPVKAGEVDPFEQANAKATERLAAAAAVAGVKKFIHLSSLFSVTDNHSSTLIDDQTDRRPSTAYGRSKRAAEQNLAAASVGRDMLAVSLRPPLVIGADAGGNWASLQRLAASGLPLPFASVDNRRSMIAAETVAKAIIHLCDGEWGPEKSGNYCIADQDALSLGEMVSELRKGMGLPSRLFAFPPGLIRMTAALLGQQRRVSGMLGSLRVDASRFREVFAFNEAPSLRHSVRESGRVYAQSHSGKRSQ